MSQKNKHNVEKKRRQFSLVTRTTIAVFFCLIGSILLILLFHQLAVLLEWKLFSNLFLYILLLLAISGFITLIAFHLFAHKLMAYEKNIRENLEEIAKGNFNIRIPLTKNKSINKTIENINTVLQELKSVKIMRSDFISNFSHELKTPMVTINGFAELLLSSDVTEEERKEYAQIIYDESNRLSKLSQSILLMNKLNSQAIVQNKSEYALDEQLRQCVAIFMREIEAKQLQIECNAQSVTYFGDADLLQQVWINLLSNAIKFSPQKSGIFISLTKEDSNAVVRIRDEGCGMSEETLKHAFDQFYQGDSSHTTEGNGLGLAIAHRIVELCDGKIEIESQPEKGSIFIVTLPLSF